MDEWGYDGVAHGVGPTISKRKTCVKYESAQRSKFSLKFHKGDFCLIFNISLSMSNRSKRKRAMGAIGERIMEIKAYMHHHATGNKDFL